MNRKLQFCSASITLYFLIAVHTCGFGQKTATVRDSIATYTLIDFLELKQQLGIEVENRPGPSGDPNASNAANTDESKVRTYELPDPLLTDKGQLIKTVHAWESLRRPELIAAFEDEMYGRLPDEIPDVAWEVQTSKDTIIAGIPITETLVLGKVDNTGYPQIDVAIKLLVGLPKQAEQLKIPVVIRIGFIDSPFGKTETPSSYFISPFEPLWKQQLTTQGWGYAILDATSIQADHGAGLTSGIIGLVNKGKHRKPEDWGVLRAWAWGVGEVIDYFTTLQAIDEDRLAIEGTSRYGKAALVAMAFEPRISLGFIGSSGAGGASLLRRNFGEMLENLASSAEYHWFCGNFIKYASIKTVNDLPVDAHELIALCAPRPVFISAGSPFIEGQWVDAKGMFLGGLYAAPVYELYKLKGYKNTAFPAMGTALTSGEIAFRQHGGGHSTGPNWSTWIAWAKKYWNK